MGSGKIKPGQPPAPQTKHIPPPAPPDGAVVFSFRYLDLTSDKFTIGDCPEGYLEKFLDRVKEVCRLTARELMTSRSSALRCHPHAWEETTEPDGFTCLKNPQLQDETAYQFTVSANEYGRVHGFFIGSIFYVVWLDPKHRLYERA